MSPDEVPCGNVRGGQGLEDLTAGGCEGKKVIRERKGTLIMVPGGSMPGGSVLSVGRGCCRVKPCGSAGSICAGMKWSAEEVTNAPPGRACWMISCP